MKNTKVRAPILKGLFKDINVSFILLFYLDKYKFRIDTFWTFLVELLSYRGKSFFLSIKKRDNIKKRDENYRFY